MRPSDHSSSRRHFLQTLTAGGVLGAALPGAAAPAGARVPYLNVADFGAVGDGKADDTAAFQKAIAAADQFSSGRVVLVPGGTYRLSEPLRLKSTLLAGQIAGGWPADTRPMPGLKIDLTDGRPALLAETGASVHGLCFAFASHGEMGPCIQLKGGGVSLSNLQIMNPAEGIMWDGLANIGRLNIENVFIVNARKCGLFIAHTMDVSTLTNVEVWNYEPDLLNTCTGFRLGQNDELRLANCAVVAAAIGFHFIETPYPNGKLGAVWGGMDNCTVDYSKAAVRVDAANVLRIHGGSLWAHHYGAQLYGRGDIILTGVDIRANGAHGLHVKECDSVTVNGCLFKKNGSQWPTAAKVQIEGGRAVQITGCTFDDTSLGINIAPGAGNFSITGNHFPRMPHPAISDHSGPTARKLVASNLVG